MEESESAPQFIDVSLEGKVCDRNETDRNGKIVVAPNTDKCKGIEETPLTSTSDSESVLLEDFELNLPKEISTASNGSIESKENNIFYGADPTFAHPISSENCKESEVSSSEPNVSIKESTETDNFRVSDSTDQTLSDEKINNQNDSFELSYELNDACPEDISRTSVESDLCHVTPCSSTSLSVPSSDESPSHNRAEVENCILAELNKVLTSLGFGIKQRKENGTNGIDSHSEEDSPVHESTLTLSEFISSLQYQLSK